MQQWNFYGLDIAGHMNADTTKYYYLKDHLGSIRVILDTTNTVISAQDYDAWGYLLENRTYQSNNTRYKFTEKERDNESNYDYFGARYYDSRIANWTSIDPLFEKHFDYTPYNYVLRNPIVLIDPDGRQIDAQTIQDARAWVNQNPWIFIVTPEIPYIGPPITVGLTILALPPPTIKIANQGSRWIIGPEGYPEVPGLITTDETPITALSSKGEISIPGERKIPLEELNPPIERGLAPTSKETGKPIEIHHIGQKKGGPYEERHRHEHRTEGSYKKYHDSKKKSQINRKEWDKMRKEYWEKEWDKGRFNQ